VWVMLSSPRSTGVMLSLLVGEGGVHRLCDVGILCSCILLVRRLVRVLRVGILMFVYFQFWLDAGVFDCGNDSVGGLLI
jgi:hypothetical protein